MPTIPLRRLVDDDQWEAEDLAGRVGFVSHAAFLRAGFVPCGEEPSSGHLLKQVDEIGPSAPRLSRLYTAAPLACRDGEGGSADAAVLELRARGDGGVEFQAYLLTRCGDRRCLCEAVLDERALAPLLAGSVADVARSLEAEEPAGSLWRSLADWVCPALLLDLCRRNDLPVTGFASLPDDIKAEILKRLTDGKDLARVECAGKQLRCLVAERDGELWKAMHDSLGELVPEVRSSDSESEGSGSWKQRYMEARRRPRRPRLFPSLFVARCLREMEAALQRLYRVHDDGEDWLARRRRQREADLQRWREEEAADLPRLPMYAVPWRRIYHVHVAPAPAPIEFTGFDAFFRRNRFVPEPEDPLLARPSEPEVAARGKNGGKRHHRKEQRNKNNYQKKRHGAGATHSPSSRYKWKHR